MNTNYSLDTPQGVFHSVEEVGSSSQQANAKQQERAYLVLEALKNEDFDFSHGKVVQIEKDQLVFSSKTANRKEKSSMYDVCRFVYQLATKDIPNHTTTEYDPGAFNKEQQELLNKKLAKAFHVLSQHYMDKHDTTFNAIGRIFSSSYQRSYEETTAMIRKVNKVLPNQ